MQPWAIGLLAGATLAAAALAGAIAFGGPGEPPPMPAINDPFRSVDWSGLPPPRFLTARDGTRLAFRFYPAAGGAPKGSVVLVHGSSGRSNSMHVLARGLAEAGWQAYALDMRGHGDSGRRGHIAYIGQLDDDLEDFMRAERPRAPATLLGFSSGGGFALRVAGSPRQQLFAHYLLLSPFIGQDAPTYRPDSGGWVSVGVPRILGLVALNAIGVRGLNELPVTNFALEPQAKAMLTPSYSYALALNFRPPQDWVGTIRAVRRPLRVVVGAQDEAFFPDRFAEAFRAGGKDVPVRILPGLGHIPLTLDPGAVRAVVEELGRFTPAPG